MGAAAVCITDIDEDRLRVAKTLGADYTLKLSGNQDLKLVAEQVENLMGTQPDITIECSGAEQSIQMAVYATKSGGTVQLVGLGKPDVTLPLVNALVREVDIRGVFRYANCYPTALSMIASGQINVKPLVTHRFALEDSLKAFETAKDVNSKSIKVMIKCVKGDMNVI
jgi:L-iditol 2-dehydrogenase